MEEYDIPRQPERYDQVLKSQNPACFRAIDSINATSWYMNPSKLLQFAQEFMRGKKETSEITKKFHSMRLRPTAFLGRRSDLQQCLRRPETSGFVSGFPFGSIPPAPGLASFILTDAMDVEHQFMILLALPIPNSDLDSDGGVFMNDPTQQPPVFRFSWPLSNQFRNGQPDLMHGETICAEFKTHLTEEQEAIQSHFLLAQSIAKSTDLKDSENNFLPMMGAFSSIRFVPDEPTIATYLNNMRGVWRLKELYKCAKEVWPITEFSRWGPTLYSDNHPMAIRKLWHYNCIDTVLTDNLLPILPRVLTDLISEYYTIDIPFIDEEAKAQMEQFPLLTGMKVQYEGQRDCPAEEVDSLSAPHTLRWDPIRMKLLELGPNGVPLMPDGSGRLLPPTGTSTTPSSVQAQNYGFYFGTPQLSSTSSSFGSFASGPFGSSSARLFCRCEVGTATCYEMGEKCTAVPPRYPR